MKKLLSIVALSLVLVSGFAGANCIGSESFSTCTDSSGNSYNVQRYGNTTITHGSNPRTGSNWNQTSTNIGNTTIHNGTSADGNSWNSTTHRIGDTSITNGTDSRGNSFSQTCIGNHCY